jgi:hypothetical protein
MKLNVFCGAIVLVSSVSANAFQAAPAGPAPGSGNAGAAAANNREQNSSYNRLVGSGVKNTVVDGSRKKGKVIVKDTPVAATAADIVAGSQLRDVEGAPLGSVESVDGDSAVVAAGNRKVRVPLIAFGKDTRGLLLGITVAKFQELASNAR